MGELFVNPWLLGGIALASAPVIIHLLNRRRYREHRWAAMDFLLQALASNRRRLKFEDLILLLLRMAVILLLVFAVSRPVLRGIVGWREDERVVVLDDSFSMEAVAPTGTVFDAARESAIHHVQDAIGGSVPVSLWLGSRPAAAAGKVEGPVQGGVVAGSVGAGGSDPEVSAALAGKDLLDTLRRAETTDLSLSFAETVQRVVEEARADRAPRVRSVVLISDFRATDWFEGDALKDPVRVACEEIGRHGLEGRIRFQFVDVGVPDLANAAVTGLELETAPILAGMPVEIAVEVTNFGAEPRVRVEGELEVGKPGSRTWSAAHRIPLPPIATIASGETARVVVKHVFEEGGEHPLRARIEHDRLPRDDEAHAVAIVRDKLRAVVVDGAPSVERFASESGLLLAALAPRGDALSGVETARIDGALAASDLRGADVLFILNRAELTISERDVVADFLAGGGGLVWFLGTNVEPERYRELWEGGQGTGVERLVLFPASLREPRAPSSTEPVRLRFADYEHPPLGLFRGLSNPSFDHVLFRRFFHLDPHPGARVIAWFTDGAGTPAILEMSVALPSNPEEGEAAPAAGRIALFNTSADRDWSDWPTDYTYPVLLQEWARHLARRPPGGRVLEIGDVLRFRAMPGVEYRLLRAEAEGEAIGGGAESGGTAAAQLRETGFQPERAGLYCLSATARSGAVPGSEAGPRAEWYAFRRSASESDLRVAGEERLRRALAPLDIELAFGNEIEVDAFRREQEGEVWRWLALGAGAFLLLELFAAWWFGRRP